MRNKALTRSRAGNFTAFLFLMIFGIFIALPMYYSIINAFKPISELFLFPPRFVVYHPTLENFADIIKVQSQSLIPTERYLYRWCLREAISCWRPWRATPWRS